jgi:hypothetical protein
MLDALWYVLTFLAGLGAGIVVKITFDASRRTKSTTRVSSNSQGTVDQRGNTVGGHMSGRDVNVKLD